MNLSGNRHHRDLAGDRYSLQSKFPQPRSHHKDRLLLGFLAHNLESDLSDISQIAESSSGSGPLNFHSTRVTQDLQHCDFQWAQTTEAAFKGS